MCRRTIFSSKEREASCLSPSMPNSIVRALAARFSHFVFAKALHCVLKKSPCAMKRIESGGMGTR